MLNRVIIDGLDMINIIYLWVILTKRNDDRLKLLSSVFIISVLTIIIEQLELNFIVIYIMIIATIKIIYKIDLKKVALAFFLVVLIEMSLQLIFSVFVNKLIYDNAYRAITIELIILIGIIIFSKVNSLNKTFTFENIDNNIFIYFILICGGYASVFKIIWNYDNTIILNNLFSTSLIFSILVVSQFLTYLYLVKVIKEKEALKVSNEYNSVISEIVQEIKQRQHDFVNYKNTIRGIVEVIDDKDVKAAIKNYMKDEDMYDNKINELMYIDNVVIRSIIYRNICKAKKYEVNFKYKIENSILDNILSFHEMSNVLNNLLNNAFDEVLKDQCIKKDIEIKILNEKETVHLIVKNQIVNPNETNLNELFTRGYSTKSTDTRGYGLYNVQKIVNLHNGYVKMNVECEEIIFNIYFNKSSG